MDHGAACRECSTQFKLAGIMAFISTISNFGQFQENKTLRPCLSQPFTNNFMSCYDFFCQTSFFKIASWVKLLFYVLTKELRDVKLKKVAFHNSLPHFPLSAIHEYVGEAVLPNSFGQFFQNRSD